MKIQNNVSIGANHSLKIAGGEIRGDGKFVIQGSLDVEQRSEIRNDLEFDGGELHVTADVSLFGTIDRQRELLALSAQEGALNLFNGTDVGASSHPAFVDIDHDRDLDVFIGNHDGKLDYYRNQGTENTPLFVRKIGFDNPFDSIDVGADAAPDFVDIDDDGDFDLFVGNAEGKIVRFINDSGSSTIPHFLRAGDADNPLSTVDVGNFAVPRFVDMDNDDDYDIFIGTEGGEILYYENTGTRTRPIFAKRTGDDNPLRGVDVGSHSAPAILDLDQDEDWDIAIGNETGEVRLFQNQGDDNEPELVEQSGSSNPFKNIEMGDRTVPAFPNIDNNGDDLDVFVGNTEGKILSFVSGKERNLRVVIDVAQARTVTINQNISIPSGSTLEIKNSGTVGFLGTTTVNGTLTKGTANVVFEQKFRSNQGAFTSTGGSITLAADSEITGGTFRVEGSTLNLPSAKNVFVRTGSLVQLVSSTLKSTAAGDRAALRVNSGAVFEVSRGMIRDISYSNIDNPAFLLAAGDAEDGPSNRGGNNFNILFNQYALGVIKDGTGTGTVLSTPAGINCGTGCQGSFNTNSTVTLSVVPNADSDFLGWSGACQGAGTTCSVALTQSTTVTARFAKKRFTLTVALTGNGTGQIQSADAQIVCSATETKCSFTYDVGTQVRLQGIATTGSSFAGWQDDCASSGRNDCTVTMTGPKLIRGAFGRVSSGSGTVIAPDASEFLLTFAKAGTGSGSVAFQGSSGASCTGITTGCRLFLLTNGQTATTTLTATPGSDSEVTSWTGCTSFNGNTCQVTLSTRSVAVEAIINKKSYVITTSIQGKGRLFRGSSPVSTLTVDHGGQVVLDLTPDAGYHVGSVTVDGQVQTVSNTLTLTNVTSNRAVRVSFEENQYAFTFTVEGEGTISRNNATINLSSFSVPHNTTDLVLSFAAEEHHTIEVLKINDVTITPTPASYAFPAVDKDQKVFIRFAKRNYLVTVSKDGSGTVSPTDPQVEYQGTKEFTITPNTHFHLTDVLVDNKSVKLTGTTVLPAGMKYSLRVTNTTELHAVFEANTHQITVQPTTNGTIVPSTITVNGGTDKPFQITPATGYRIEKILIDGQAISSTLETYTFQNIEANHTIGASFVVAQYPITITTQGVGTVTPASGALVSHGGSVTLQLTPGGNNVVSDVLVDQLSQVWSSASNGSGTYVLSNVTQPKTVQVVFGNKTYRIGTTVQNATVTPANKRVEKGTSLLFQFAPQPHYTLQNIVVDGVSKGVITSYQLNNIGEDHSIQVVATPNLYKVSVTPGVNGTITSSKILQTMGPLSP